MSLSCQHIGNLFQRIIPTAWRSSGLIVSSSIYRSFEHFAGTKGIDKKKLPGNAYGSHGTKTIIKYRDKHSTRLEMISFRSTFQPSTVSFLSALCQRQCRKNSKDMQSTWYQDNIPLQPSQAHNRTQHNQKLHLLHSM